MGELTRAQRATLLACPDWSAPFEVMHRRHKATGAIVSPRGLRNTLGRLRNLGLVEHSMPNGTYRILPGARSALSNATTPETGSGE
jgi:hypothetical protein